MNFLKHIIKKFLTLLYSIKYGSCGNGVRIQKPYVLLNNKKCIYFGSNIFIRKNARIEPIRKWQTELYFPKIIIEDGVVIEQNLHLTCANFVKIGSFSSINSYVFITDIDHEYRDISQPILSQPLIVQETEIGKYCFIGTGVKILAGVHIGEHSIIGANAVVTHDIPPFSVAAGIPAKVIKKYDFNAKKWIKV